MLVEISAGEYVSPVIVPPPVIILQVPPVGLPTNVLVSSSEIDAFEVSFEAVSQIVTLICFVLTHPSLLVTVTSYIPDIDAVTGFATKTLPLLFPFLEKLFGPVHVYVPIPFGFTDNFNC